jgi:adenosine deaminase CECR1
LTPLYNVVLHNFFENKEKVQNSRLFKVLDAMPKGGLHHIHTTAAPHVDTYIELTYEKETHYNEREGLFKVFPDMHHEDGYVSCVEMRNFKVDKAGYDESLRQQILQTDAECTGYESHEIWQYFQYKFARIGGLGKYKPFFKRLLRSSIKACIDQNVFIVELRHTTGCLFDENKKPVPLLEECALIQEIIDETRKEVPYFRMSLIFVSYKIVGHTHVNKILDHLKIAKAAYPELIGGFDLVNEEEYTPGIQEFMPAILGAQ